MSIRVGGVAKVNGKFRNAAGALADPTTVTFTYRTADGDETTWTYGTDPEIVKNSIGDYDASIVLSVAGRLDYEWIGTGSVVGSDRGSLRVADGGLDSIQLTTTSELDAILARSSTASSYTNAQKNDAIDLASAAFEGSTNVAFTSRSRTVTLDGAGSVNLLLPDSNITEITEITVDGDTIDPDDVVIDTQTGMVYWADGWPRARLNTTITYTYGYATTPADVSHAVAVLAASILKDGPYDDRGYGISDDGGAIRLLTAGVSGATFSIPEVEACADRYRIPAIV